jgi:hypothetical protein
MKRFLTALAFVVGASSVFAQAVVETILAGTRFSVEAIADGYPPPTFEWFKDGVKVSSGTTFMIDAVDAASAGDYTVKATNSEGSATSSPYTLKVDTSSPPPPPPPPPPSGDLPVFTLQPKSVVAPPMGEAVFSGQATGAVSYQWFRNGITFGHWNSEILTLSGITLNDAGEYILKATNAAGTKDSDPATLTVETPAEPTPAAPVFTKHPVDTIITVGFELRLEVSVTGYPTPDLQWEKDGAAIAGATSNVYSVTVAGPEAAGEYLASARSSSGVATSNAALVSVKQPDPIGIPPKILVAPANLTVPKKANVRFEVAAEGEGLRYQWKKGTSNLLGQTSSVLLLTQVNPGSSGTYTVTVSNAHGSVNTSARLTVR